MMGWQWHQLDHMQMICTSLQTDNYTSNSTLNFTGWMLFMHDGQPIVQNVHSKVWKLYCVTWSWEVTTDLPNSDDGVGDQNKKNDKRFDKRCHLVVRLFEPRQHLHMSCTVRSLHRQLVHTVGDSKNASHITKAKFHYAIQLSSSLAGRRPASEPPLAG